MQVRKGGSAVSRGARAENRGFHALGSGQEKQRLLFQISISNFTWDNGN